jgi:hypothetical protein
MKIETFCIGQEKEEINTEDKYRRKLAEYDEVKNFLPSSIVNKKICYFWKLEKTF